MCVTDTDRQSDGLKRCGARLAIRPDDQAVAGRRSLKAVEAALEDRHPTRRATAQRRHPHRVLAAVVAAEIDQVANHQRVALVDIWLRRKPRSEAPPVGKARVSTCRFWWQWTHPKKKQ